MPSPRQINSHFPYTNTVDALQEHNMLQPLLVGVFFQHHSCISSVMQFSQTSGYKSSYYNASMSKTLLVFQQSDAADSI